MIYLWKLTLLTHFVIYLLIILSFKKMQKQLYIPASFSHSELVGNSPSELFFTVENQVTYIQRRLLQERQQSLQRILESQQPNRPETVITQELVQQELNKIMKELSQLPKKVKANSNRMSAKIDIPRIPLTSPSRVTKQDIDRRARSNSKPICFMIDGDEGATPPLTPYVIHCPVSKGRVNITSRGDIPKPSLSGHREYSYDSDSGRISQDYGFYFYTNDKQSDNEPIYDRTFDISTPSNHFTHSPPKSPKQHPIYKIHKKRPRRSKPDKKLHKPRISSSSSSYNPISTPVHTSTPIIIQVPSYPMYSPAPYNYSPYSNPYSSYYPDPYNQYSNIPPSPQYSYHPDNPTTDNTPQHSQTHQIPKSTLESATQCSIIITPTSQDKSMNKTSIFSYSGLAVEEDTYNETKSFEYSYSPGKKNVSTEIVPTLEMSQQYPEPPMAIIPRDPWSAEYGSLRGKKLAEVFQHKRPETLQTMKERDETLEKMNHKNKSRKELLRLRKEMLQAPTNKIRKLIQNR